MTNFSTSSKINSYPLFAQFLILFGTVLLCGLVLGGGVQLLFSLKYGLTNIQAATVHPLQYPQLIFSLKWMQLIMNLSAFGLSAIMFAFLKSDDGFGYLKLKLRNNNFGSFAFIPFIVITTLPIIAFLYYYNQQINFGVFDKLFREWELQGAELTKAFLNVQSISGLLFNLVVIALCPAIAEELLFRGVLQNLLSEKIKNQHVVIIISAIIFSAIHMQFLGFVPRMIIGAVLGYMYYWSGNLFTSIFAHFLNNAISVVAAYLYYNRYISMNIDEVGHYGFISTAIATITLIGFLIFFKKLFYTAASKTTHSS